MDPNNNSVIYSGGYVYTTTYQMAVSKSSDAATTWLRDTLSTVYSTCDAIRVDPTNSNVVYAGGYTGMYKSVDAGNTWNPSSTGLSGTVYDIAVNAQRADVLYAGTSSGVFKSTNAGASWSNTGCTNVYAVLVDPVNPLTVYSGTYTGVYKSTAGGGSWSAMNTGLQDLYVTSLNIYPNTWLICGTKGAGMYRWNLVVGAEERGQADAGFGIFVQPNPTRCRTVVHYALPRAMFVTVALYDVQGRLVVTLVNEEKSAGLHEAVWNVRERNGGILPSGVYFCHLNASDFRLIEKVVVID
jgi:hypothetical protein